ncbi:MAG: hypothetical protein DWQ01_05410 [Planctomycetota bacterium]|nr:MAG: hypothetical protein DWQ01_05410 [Planctomycetota bacterium]
MLPAWLRFPIRVFGPHPEEEPVVASARPDYYRGFGVQILRLAGPGPDSRSEGTEAEGQDPYNRFEPLASRTTP